MALAEQATARGVKKDSKGGDGKGGESEADAQDDDTLAELGVSCTVGGSSPVWDALTTRWTCEVVDTVLSEAEVESFITNDPVALAVDTTGDGTVYFVECGARRRDSRLASRAPL